MAKKPTLPADGPVEQLNALIPADLKRRMKIASANTGMSMTELLIQWINRGLSETEEAIKNPKSK